MDRADRGRKHSCPGCAAKFYDLGKPGAACPRCGAKPAPAKPARPAALARSRGAPFRRYP